MHVAAGPRGSGHPSNIWPGHESSAQFDLQKTSIIKISQGDSGLCCLRAIVTIVAVHIWRGTTRENDENGPIPTKPARLQQATDVVLAEAGLRAGPMGLPEVDRLANVSSMCDYKVSAPLTALVSHCVSHLCLIFFVLQIVVVDANRQFTCFVYSQGNTQLAIGTLRYWTRRPLRTRSRPRELGS